MTTTATFMISQLKTLLEQLRSELTLLIKMSGLLIKILPKAYSKLRPISLLKRMLSSKRKVRVGLSKPLKRTP